jgi:16S rRNA (guanine527-N7)-methyltransferase
MNEELTQILQTGANEIGAPLSTHQVEKFSLYLSELKKWNKKINLTSLNEDQEIVVKHFLDSLTPLPHVPMGSFIMDLGSGGGLPGIPMKIARPAFAFCFLIQLAKRFPS